MSSLAAVARPIGVDEYILWQILDSLPIPVYFKDRNCRFTYVNNACAKLLSLTDPNLAIGRTDENFFAPELAREWIEQEKRIIRNGAPLVAEKEEEQWLDRPRTWAWTTKLPLCDASGDVLGIVGISKDITETERELKRYRLAVDGARDGLWHRVIGAEEVWFSARWKDILGFEEHELPNTLSTLMNRIHPEDLPKVEFERQRHFTGATRYYECDFRMLHKDGTYRWIRARGKVVRDAFGNALEFAGSHTDITDTQDNENFYRTVLDTLPDLIFVKDGELRFVFVNRAVADNFGLSKSEIYGKTDAHLNPDRKQVEHFWMDDRLVLDTGQAREIAEEELTDKRSGAKRVLATKKFPLVFPGSAGPHVLGIATDITNLKNAKRDLENERDLLQNLMNNIPDGIFFKDPQLRFTRVNNALAQYAGAKVPDELLHRTDFEVFGFDPGFARHGYESDQEILRTKKPVQRVFPLLTSVGQQWRLVSKAPILDSTGSVVQIVGISKDITELENAKRNLETVLLVLTDAVGEIQQARTEEDACQAAVGHMQTLEHPSVMLSFLTELNGEQYVVANPEYATGKWKKVADSAQYRWSVPDAELTLVHTVLQSRQPRFIPHSGKDKECDRLVCRRAEIISQYVVPLATDSLKIGILQVDTGESKERPSVECAMYDVLAAHLSIVIERHRRLQQLQTLDARLLSQAKFIAFNSASTRIVHELNHSVSQYLIKLNRAKSLPEIRTNKAALDFLKETSTFVDRWFTSLNEQLRPMREEHELKEHDVESIITDVVGAWLQKANTWHCKLEHASHAPGARVAARLGELKEILSCMIINAIEATARRITIQVQRYSEIVPMAGSKHYIDFLIIDDGNGIPPQFRDRIFDFGWTSKGELGHGIGLTIVETIVKNLGGSVSLRSGGKSAGEKETVFCLRLPAC